MRKVDFQFLTLICLPPGKHGVDKEILPFQKIGVPKISLDMALLVCKGLDRRSLLEVFEKLTQSTVLGTFFCHTFDLLCSLSQRIF